MAAGAIGRWAMVLAIALFPYAREQGLGSSFQKRGGAALPVASILVVLLLLLEPLRLLAAWGAAGVLTVLVGWLARRRLGGCTGDIYGAIEVLADLCVLVVLLWR